MMLIKLTVLHYVCFLQYNSQNTCVIGNILLAAAMESEYMCCLFSCCLSGWVRVCSHHYIEGTKGEYGNIYLC